MDKSLRPSRSTMVVQKMGKIKIMVELITVEARIARSKKENHASLGVRYQMDRNPTRKQILFALPKKTIAKAVVEPTGGSCVTAQVSYIFLRWYPYWPLLFS